MKTESTIKPINNFEIENIKDDVCDVVFFSDISKIEKTVEEETVTMFVYNTYRVSVPYRENLTELIEKDFNVWLDFAKKCYYDLKAKEVRSIRDKLLADSDKNMALDRLNFDIPKSITMTNIVTAVKAVFSIIDDAKNGEWATYRQELRDLTKQEGFPYNVEFPNKPE